MYGKWDKLFRKQVHLMRLARTKSKYVGTIGLTKDSAIWPVVMSWNVRNCLAGRDELSQQKFSPKTREWWDKFFYVPLQKSTARWWSGRLLMGNILGSKNRICCYQGCNEGGKGAQFPGGRVTMRVQNHCGGAKKSQQCHKYFLQYSKFQYGKSNMGRQTCFLPRAPSNLVTPLVAITANFLTLDVRLHYTK